MTTLASQPADVESRGLTSAEVVQRRQAGQVNDYRLPTSRPLSVILRTNIATRFNALLGSMLVVIVIVGPLQDALFGLALVANTLVGIVQELRAKRALDRLAVVTAPRATVIRDGQPQSIPSGDIVVDDVLELGAGDQLVVDGRVLSAEALQLDESLLSGESHPVVKHAGDRVLSGSIVIGGSARCRVTEVGENSYAAGLSSAAREFGLARSELRDGINRILQLITWVLIPTAALLFWSQLGRAGHLSDSVRGAVAGTVTMVPEGLVLLTSVAFAVGALRLARRRVLARELPAIEGLARVDTLCIDKTGTLTSGRLTVESLHALADDPDVESALSALARIEPKPNATAAALANRFPAVSWAPTRTFPFTSAQKWSGADFGPNGTWVLGAPEVLTNDPDIQRRTEELAGTGVRVLLLAERMNDDNRHVRPAALICLTDEIRPDAARTLAYLGGQGVAVRVLSGDHPGTVASIARRVGLDPTSPVDARTVDVADPELASLVEQTTVFGRVTPEQKQAFVMALQSRGHVVAMTGDGVNDVLALKAADVGIAMGSGSPASRAVAQLVLLDSAFTAVPNVIGEGRRVIANMERVANLFLTKTVYATLLALAVGFARLPFPFLPRHLTLVSTLTIGVPAFVLALAPNAERARPHFIGRVARFAIPTGLVAAAATYLTYLVARDDGGTSLAAARTLCTIVLSAIALWVLALVARTGSSSARWLVPTMAAGMVVALLVPSWRTFFALSVPRPVLLLAGVGIAALAGMAMETGWRLSGWVGGRLRRVSPPSQ